MTVVSESATHDGVNPLSRSRLYFDNSATSFPKPPAVTQAMIRYATEIGASGGRGQYAEAQASSRVMLTCRERLNTLFNGENPLHFVFSLNCSDALNIAVKGMLRPGDHMITTRMDHNSVLRQSHALHDLTNGDITTTYVEVDPITCLVDPEGIRKAIRPNTKLIAINHVSNVTGTIQPIRAIGKIAREAHITYLVDAAQSAGHVPIDVQADFIDLMAFPGHKGLLGPLGTGALYIRPGLEKELRPLRHGGTGSVSDHAWQPDFMPDKFESGSHNAIGLAGLSEGIQWILDKGVQKIFEHDQTLSRAFMDGVEGVDGLRYLGPQGIRHRTGVFSMIVDGIGPVDLARRLENEFGILSRAGIHCAPYAHAHLGTVERGGTTRLSFGPFLTVLDVKYAADALASITQEIHAKPVPVG